MLFAVGIGCFAALVAILYGVGAASLKQARERSAELQLFAASQGLSFLDPLPEDATALKQRRPDHGVSISSEYPDFPFKTCRSYHVLEGEQRGRKVRLFELAYVVSTGKHTHTVIYGVASAHLGKSVPKVDVRFEGLWQKLKEMLGKPDVQFDNPEFDKKYLVTAVDEDFARSVFDYQVQEDMLRTPYDGHMLTGEWAMVYAMGTPSVDKLKDLLERAHKLADRASRGQ